MAKSGKTRTVRCGKNGPELGRGTRKEVDPTDIGQENSTGLGSWLVVSGRNREGSKMSPKLFV